MTNEFPPINPPFKRKPKQMEGPEDFDLAVRSEFPVVFDMPEMMPQIMPSKSTQFKHIRYEDAEKKSNTKALGSADKKDGRLIQKRKRTADELKSEADRKMKEMLSVDLKEREKTFKWRKQPFQQKQTRRDNLTLQHYRHIEEKDDRIIKYFSRFNTKSTVITYESDQEYYDAKLDQLPSSTSWTKEETDCLMYLC